VHTPFSGALTFAISSPTLGLGGPTAECSSVQEGARRYAVHTITIFPIGNGDTLRIDFENFRKMLIDFADMRDPGDKEDKRISLSNELKLDLAAIKRDFYDVVAFTHLDDDHARRASEFFFLEHAKVYQSDDRVKINELWVPAAAIIEEGSEDDARVIRAEARYRLKAGKSIRVFSRPDKLKDWLKKEGLTLKDRQHLITDAGQIAPGFSDTSDQVEFFVHSPFASRVDDGELLDRNTDALVLHATFRVGTTQTRVFFGSDIDHAALDEIVRVTKLKKREERLDSEIVKIPHHCSYLSIGPEKGKEKTKPIKNIAYFYEKKLQANAILVSSSDPIPNKDTDQPPHYQAAAYYRERRDAVGGEFLVTMEHPNETEPEPIVIEIAGDKGKVKKLFSSGVAVITASRAPRAGIQ
jgi:hypothetical protein